jgi:regulator of ribonuclease activity A
MLRHVTATADILDEHGDAASVCEAELRQYGGVRAFQGPIATVRCYEDNLLLKELLAEPGDGRVLVVDGGGSVRVALVGDKVAALARDSGWAGIVINGAVRDVATLPDVEVGLKALGSNPRRSTKEGTGELAVPLSFGGIVFSPGAMLYSDDDGVVVMG